jgi:hypothetical protein
MGSNKGRQPPDLQDEVPGTGWAAAGMGPDAQPVTAMDPSVLQAERNFAEALNQGRALATPGSSEAAHVALLLQKTTARPHGLQYETALRQAVTPVDIHKLVQGPHPTGKAAEVVVARVYKDHHAGNPVEMVNGPKHVASNVVDVRLTPDASSRRDLLFQVQLPDGTLFTTPGGQVKTGSNQYLTNTLTEMAQSRGYGRTAYVDARFVNTDGSPRVAADGFTPSQAAKLKEAGVCLRGIPELDRQAEELVANLLSHQKDGLTPEARVRLQQLRNAIAAAYQPGGIVSRAFGGAALAAASSAVMSLGVQLLSGAKVDLMAVARVAGEASLVAGASTLADAALYHLSSWLGSTPEVAQAMAAQGVSAGFFLIAVGTDAVSEVRAALSGERTTSDAVMGTSVKVILDALPMMLAPLGLLGMPIALASQVGGRWVIQRVRQSDARVRQALADNLKTAKVLEGQLGAMAPAVQQLRELSDEMESLHSRLMQGHHIPKIPAIH